VPDDRLRPVALRYDRGGWLARLGRLSRRFRIRRFVFHRFQAFGERWKGRTERLGPRATFRLALRGRLKVRSLIGGGTAFIRMTSHLEQHFHGHEHVAVVVKPAAELHRNTPADRPHASRDGRGLSAAEVPYPRSLVIRREHHQTHRSRLTDVRRIRVIERDRLETITAHQITLAEVVAHKHGVIPSADAPRMVLRPAPRAESGDPKMSRDRRLLDEPPPAHPATVAPAPKVEVDIEGLTDKVLWRIERRVIAQRERMGKG
jgi:hypothetical protein